jgi:hypothetical protein
MTLHGDWIKVYSVPNNLAIFGSEDCERCGRRMWKVEPGHFSSSYPVDSTQIAPPCASMIPRVIAKPKPGPPPLNFVFPLECKDISPTCSNFSKIVAWSSSDIPMPVSVIVTYIKPGRSRPSIVTLPPSGVNLIAFMITFLNA